MTRKALIVGLDYYEHLPWLSGCVHDAHSVARVLGRHADGRVNFPTPKILTTSAENDVVSRIDLKAAVRELFADDSELALFYFAGHGYIEDTGGFLCAGDCVTGDDGLSLAEIISIASTSKAQNKVIVLDSCYSGVAGNGRADSMAAEIVQGTSILTASTATQYAMESPGGGSGVFTDLFVDALEGAAANLVGEVTPGSVYAHIDQSLGPWAQRPVFKTNVKSFVSLRTATAPISYSALKAISTLFPSPDFEIQLDPSYEPERGSQRNADPDIPPPDPAKNADFAILQEYAKVNLVRPVGAPHMWHAAMQSKPCRLTALGQHYRRLVADELI